LSRLGEDVLILLNRFAPPANQAMCEAMQNEALFSKWEESYAEDVFRSFLPYIDLRDKEVLDIGTGLGGKLAYMRQKGPHRITTVDIIPTHSLHARAYVAKNNGGTSIEFVAADAGRLPFQDNSFDAIFSYNTFEHIAQPLQALRESVRVLRPGGYIYLGFPPYYSPWGAHMNRWLYLPWPQLLFSERTIINAAARIDERTQLNARSAPLFRLDFRNPMICSYVNKLTVSQFERMLKQVPLRVIYAEHLPLGWRVAPRAARLMHLLVNLPGLQEIFTSQAIYVLQHEV